MAQENVDAVRRLFEAVNAQDYAAALETVADDVVLVIHGDVSGLAGEGAVGKAAFSRWFGDWFRVFEDGYRFELSNARADGDRVLADVTHHAHGRLSGAAVTMDSRWVYTLRDGKIVRCDGYSR